ncbi:MAG: cation:proton antiporter [Burkholderiales bacterium]
MNRPWACGVSRARKRAASAATVHGTSRAFLAGTVGKDHLLVRRLRTLTFGLLTPFYFIRAGSFVSVSALVSGFGAFVVLLLAKMATKFVGVYPVTKIYDTPNKEAMYTTLLMSTGLTFGSISALFGLSHNIIDQTQYSILIGVVVASAVVPTLIANAWFLPHHLIPYDGLLVGERRREMRRYELEGVQA